MAQLVARSVRDAEVVSSSLIALTIKTIWVSRRDFGPALRERDAEVVSDASLDPFGMQV